MDNNIIIYSIKQIAVTKEGTRTLNTRVNNKYKPRSDFWYYFQLRVINEVGAETLRSLRCYCNIYYSVLCYVLRVLIIPYYISLYSPNSPAKLLHRRCLLPLKSLSSWSGHETASELRTFSTWQITPLRRHCLQYFWWSLASWGRWWLDYLGTFEKLEGYKNRIDRTEQSNSVKWILSDEAIVPVNLVIRLFV